MYETEQITTSWLYTTSGDRENWRSLQHCIRHTLNAAQSNVALTVAHLRMMTNCLCTICDDFAALRA